MEYKISNSNKQVSFRFGNEDDPKTVLNMIKFVTQQFDDEEEDSQPHQEGLATDHKLYAEKLYGGAAND